MEAHARPHTTCPPVTFTSERGSQNKTIMIRYYGCSNEPTRVGDEMRRPHGVWSLSRSLFTAIWLRGLWKGFTINYSLLISSKCRVLQQAGKLWSRTLLRQMITFTATKCVCGLRTTSALHVFQHRFSAWCSERLLVAVKYMFMFMQNSCAVFIKASFPFFVRAAHKERSSKTLYREETVCRRRNLFFFLHIQEIVDWFNPEQCAAVKPPGSS